MWTRYRKCEPPCTKIPNNWGYKNWDYKCDTKRCRCMRNHCKRKEMHNTHCYSSSTKKDSEEVQKRCNEDRFFWWERMTINNRSDSVGSIIHTIHEFESKNNTKTEDKNNKREFHRKWVIDDEKDIIYSVTIVRKKQKISYFSLGDFNLSNCYYIFSTSWRSSLPLGESSSRVSLDHDFPTIGTIKPFSARELRSFAIVLESLFGIFL